jgi:hypothetical protein
MYFATKSGHWAVSCFLQQQLRLRLSCIRVEGQFILHSRYTPTFSSNYSGCLHGQIKVPVNDRNEMLKSPIQANDPRAELIKEAALWVWDEAPMANRAVMSCTEETCRVVMENDEPFGGKVVVLLGDFRQTCPVIRRGTRAQVVDASIKSSELWPLFSAKTHRATM